MARWRVREQTYGLLRSTGRIVEIGLELVETATVRHPADMGCHSRITPETSRRAPDLEPSCCQVVRTGGLVRSFLEQANSFSTGEEGCLSAFRRSLLSTPTSWCETIMSYPAPSGTFACADYWRGIAARKKRPLGKASRLIRGWKSSASLSMAL